MLSTAPFICHTSFDLFRGVPFITHQWQIGVKFTYDACIRCNRPLSYTWCIQIRCCWYEKHSERSCTYANSVTAAVISEEQGFTAPNEMHWWKLILLVSISREHNECSGGFNDILAQQSVICQWAEGWCWNLPVTLIPPTCRKHFTRRLNWSMTKKMTFLKLTYPVIWCYGY